jgi:hypothetical protein
MYSKRQALLMHNFLPLHTPSVKLATSNMRLSISIPKYKTWDRKVMGCPSCQNIHFVLRAIDKMLRLGI